VSSFTVAGSASEGGQSVTFHASADHSGDLVAKVGLQGNTTGNISLVEKSGLLYFKGDKAAWRSWGVDATLAGRLVGRWFSAPANSPQGRHFLSSGGFWKLSNLIGQHGGDGYTKLPPSTFDGHRVVVLTVSSGDDAGAIIDISAIGPAYILRIVQPGQGGFVFSNLGVPLHVVVPPGAIPFPSS
jgi:hypothetical protein